MTKATILFVWDNPPSREQGGVEHVTHILMTELAKCGFCVTFLSCLSEDATNPDKLSAFIHKHKVEVVIYQNGSNPRFIKILKDVDLNIPCIACFHSAPDDFKHYYSLKNIIHRIANCRTSGIIKDLLRVMVYPLWRFKTLYVLHSRIRESYALCSRFVLLSKSVRESAIKTWSLPNSSKLVFVGNPLTYAYHPEQSRSLVQKKEGLLIVSRLEERQKRITLALKSWSIAEKFTPENWYLDIVGTGSDAKYLEHLTRKLRIKRVRFWGRQVPVSFYQKAAIFLMTSAYEGWGLTLSEAQQFGVVPIAMDSYESLRDIIIDRQNGIIVKNGDFRHMATAIIELASNRNERYRLAENAIKDAARFSIDSTISQWKTLIKDTLKK